MTPTLSYGILKQKDLNLFPSQGVAGSLDGLYAICRHSYNMIGNGLYYKSCTLWTVWMLYAIGITKAIILPYFAARRWLVLEVALMNIGTKMKHVINVYVCKVYGHYPLLSWPKSLVSRPGRGWCCRGEARQ